MPSSYYLIKVSWLYFFSWVGLGRLPVIVAFFMPHYFYAPTFALLEGEGVNVMFTGFLGIWFLKNIMTIP